MATSRLLAQRGASVVGTGRDAGALTSAGLRDAGGPFVATIARDLTEEDAPATVVAAAAGTLGGLDLVISNAGSGWLGRFEEMTSAEIDAVLDVNLRVAVHLAHAAAPWLRESAAPGQLVLVGSIAGLLGVPEEAVYSTAKAALGGLANSLRGEWRPVTVTLVSPGVVDTQFFARRNRPYARSWPRPMPVSRVAAAIVGGVERRQNEVIVPVWLTLPARLAGGLPSLYSALSQRWG
jgi:short-subunit dehydrogenase